MWPVIPFILPVIDLGWHWLVTILQWPSIEAML